MATKEKEVEEDKNVDLSREERANKVIKNNMLYNLGVGLIPIPLLDMAAITTIQILMLRKLAKIYDIPFKEERTKSIVTSLITGISPSLLGRGIGSALKAVPVIGTVLGFAMVPVFAAGSTYALGKVFMMHFESGGTFLDFDPEKVSDYYKEKFEEGKEMAKGMNKKEGRAKPAATAAKKQ